MFIRIWVGSLACEAGPGLFTSPTLAGPGLFTSPTLVAPVKLNMGTDNGLTVQEPLEVCLFRLEEWNSLVWLGVVPILRNIEARDVAAELCVFVAGTDDGP